jgi:hypothetical protein
MNIKPVDELLIEKELLGLAGEYAVAAELCKRRIYAQLTLGNHKSTDLLVESESSMLRISVKTKQGKQWPAVKGIYRLDEFIVFLDYENKGVQDLPDFYILDRKYWIKVVKAATIDKTQVIIDDKNCVHYPDGWKGLNINPQMISKYMVTKESDGWQLIKEAAKVDR